MLAGDEADLLSLVLRADLTGLPPLLVPAVQHVQHVPELEAQRLAEEAAVRSLVVVKKSPGDITVCVNLCLLLLLSLYLSESSYHPDRVHTNQMPKYVSNLRRMFWIGHPLMQAFTIHIRTVCF